MKPSEIRIAISGFGGLNNPHPGAPVAEALREGWRGPMQIHAFGSDPMMMGAWMPGVADRLHILPFPSAGDEAILERVLEIHRDVGLDAIIPCLDLEVPVFSRLASRFQREGIATLVPSPESLYVTSKLRLPVFSFENEIRTPKTIHVFDLHDLPLHAEQFGFPLIVKGLVTGAKWVNTVDQARKEAEVINARFGGGVLLQEALTGDQLVVGAVVGRSGACIGQVAMRKLGINPDGKAIFGSVVDDPKIERDTKQILSKLDWAGPLELEFIRPYGSNRLCLIEINCRFPSWIMLSHFAGCNLPVRLVHEMLEPKRRQPSARPRPGTMFVRDVQETAVPLEMIDQLERHGSHIGVVSTKRHRRPSGKNSLSVAVTGLGNSDVVNAGLGVIAALDGLPEIGRVLGLGYGAFDSGLYRSDSVESVFRLPQEDNAESLLHRLAEIHHEKRIDVILPCLDLEIPRFIAIEPALKKLGIRTLLPSREAFARREKTNLSNGSLRGNWAGFEVTRTLRARSEADVLNAADRFGFPVAIKGPVSGSIAAHNRWQARAGWFEMRDRGFEEALVQPFISGDCFAVAAVCDRNHQAVTMLTVRKILTCERGSTWGAINSPQPELESAFADLLKHLRWVGPVEAEFIRDRRCERFYLLEVNPRFTAWISFSAKLGHNHPYQAACLALDRSCKSKPETTRHVFMRSCRDLFVRPMDFAAISTRGRRDNG